MTEWIEGRLPDRGPVRVSFEHGHITAMTEISDAPDVLLLPGLVDLQVNGYAGFDANSLDVSAAEIVGLVRALWQHGVTTLCPTVITGATESMHAALRAIVAARASDPLVAHSIAGIHVEGPYLSTLDGARGAHSAAHLHDPNIAEFASWQRAAAGLVRIVTLAPERAGSFEYIAALADQGVIASIGHTAASPGQVAAAVTSGATMSTHLGNASEAMLPRNRNHIWAQLAADSLAAGFIADGHHLPAETFTAMVRAKGVARSFLVSDSVALAGCAPGDYATPVGGRVTVQPDGRLVLAGTEFLAGSGSSLDQCLEWATTATPLAFRDAVTMATGNPARLLNLTDRGRLEVSAAADIIAVDTNAGFTVRKTIVAGRAAY